MRIFRERLGKYFRGISRARNVFWPLHGVQDGVSLCQYSSSVLCFTCCWRFEGIFYCPRVVLWDFSKFRFPCPLIGGAAIDSVAEL